MVLAVAGHEDAVNGVGIGPTRGDVGLSGARRTPFTLTAAGDQLRHLARP